MKRAGASSEPGGGRRDGRLLVVAIAAGVVVALFLWTWSVNQSLADIRRTQARLQILADSLRSHSLMERRVEALEQRVERSEKGLTRGLRAARVSDVVAVRRWVRRLDEETLANRRRLDRLDRVLDSVRTHRDEEELQSSSPAVTEGGNSSTGRE
jgi:hypothetical protein